MTSATQQLPQRFVDLLAGILEDYADPDEVKKDPMYWLEKFLSQAAAFRYYRRESLINTVAYAATSDLGEIKNSWAFREWFLKTHEVSE